jgi:hypothetical protein
MQWVSLRGLSENTKETKSYGGDSLVGAPTEYGAEMLRNEQHV